MKTKLLLSVRDAARAVGCTFHEMLELLCAGKISSVRIGLRHLVDPADLKDYIAREKKLRTHATE